MTDTKFLSWLGGNIRAFRLEKGMTQIELAIRCGFEKASMSRIESGRTNITVITLRKISTALNADLTDLFKTLEGNSVRNQSI